MSQDRRARVDEVLNAITEVMSGLMIEQNRKRMSELDLTLPQSQALRVLRRGPIPAGQLAMQLRISAPAMTQLTDRLARKGLIERQAMAGDRRCVLVALSARGRELVDHFRKRRTEIFNGALAQLGEDEQLEVVVALEKIVVAMKRYEATPDVGTHFVNRRIGTT